MKKPMKSSIALALIFVSSLNLFSQTPSTSVATWKNNAQGYSIVGTNIGSSTPV